MAALLSTASAVGRTALRAAALTVIVASVVFVFADLLPGDATTALVERGAPASAVERARDRLGLDRPLAQRLGSQLGDLTRGDLGRTARGRPVGAVLDAPLRRTLVMGGLAFAIVALGGVALGSLLAWRAGGRIDQFSGAALATLLCLPEFVVLTGLTVVLAAWLGLVPAVVVPGPDGAVAAPALIVPVLALAVPNLAWTARVVRGAVSDVLRMPHVESAILDGLSPGRILSRHVLPLALPAIAASLATSCASLFGGAVVVEMFVNYPGLGSVLTQAVEARDVGLVTGVVVLVSLIMIAVFALADFTRRVLPGARAA